MQVNARNKIISLILISLGLFAFSTTLISAQNFPPQPEVPPCVGCGFSASPTPSPSLASSPAPIATIVPIASPTATAAATPSATPNVVLGTSDSTTQDPHTGGQVLALSATSASETNFVFSVLAGLICISLGMRIYTRVSESE